MYYYYYTITIQFVKKVNIVSDFHIQSLVAHVAKVEVMFFICLGPSESPNYFMSYAKDLKNLMK